MIKRALIGTLGLSCTLYGSIVVQSADASQQIFSSIELDNTTTLSELCKNKENFFIFDQQGHTPLHAAAYHGSIRCAKLLLDHGSPIDAHDNTVRKSTPLQIALNRGNTLLVDLLLDRGADVHIRDQRGLSALSYAFASNCPTKYLVNSLFEKGSRIGELQKPTLVIASATGSIASVNYILRPRGLIQEQRTSQNRPPQELKDRALSTAVQFNDEEIAELLIKHGANPQTVIESTGEVLLLYAIREGYDPIVQLLLSSGACKESETSDGIRALSLAASLGHTASVQALLGEGACIDARSRDGKTALLHAAEKGHYACVEELLNRGASPLVQDILEKTALYYAHIQLRSA